jgi:hypothetical protein
MMCDTTTNNGAPSLSSTCDARLDLFFKATRNLGGINMSDYQNETLYNLIDASWKVDPLDTMRILFNWRDCRGGKGDHSGFIAAMAYIGRNNPEWLLENFKIIPEYGCYLDLIKLFHLVKDPDIKFEIMENFCTILKKDQENLKSSPNAPISLLAKWIPSENSKYDRWIPKQPRFLITMCKQLGFSFLGSVHSDHLKTLRKEMISPLRKHIDLVETKMCQSNYKDIDYEKVPSLAMHKYRMAFMRNDGDRFAEYLCDVKKGKAKINSNQMYPHDLVRSYLNYHSDTEDPVIETMWTNMKKQVSESGVFNDSIVVCDVSGSLNGTPMEVAIALGLLSLDDEKNRNLITFSSEPKLHTVPPGLSLKDQVQDVIKMDWGQNTNFKKTMELVIGISSLKKDAIKRIYVFSDMQFDMAFPDLRKGGLSHFELMRDKFQHVGIEMPQIIFWNLNGTTKDFPVSCDEKGVIMLSGYSQTLLKTVMTKTDVTPLTVMLDIIRSPRYSMVCAPNA